MSPCDPKRTLAICPKAKLSSPIRPMLVAAHTIAGLTTKRSVTHAVMTTNTGNTELDNDTRLEKRTFQRWSGSKRQHRSG